MPKNVKHIQTIILLIMNKESYKNMLSNKEYDLVIIGAGPVGLYAAFLAGYFRLETLCLELDEFVGGQASKLYPNKKVHDFPGQLEITADELVQTMYRQAIQFNNVKLQTKTKIVKYAKTNDDKIILYDDQDNEYITKNVLFTVGLGAFEPVKVTDEVLKSKNLNINYHHKKDSNYNGKKIIILGGGDSAVEYAYQIKDKYPEAIVTLIHRNEKLRAIVHSHDELIKSNINVVLNASIHSIDVNEITINESEQLITYSYDYILVQYGLKSLGSNIHSWPEFIKNKNKFIVNDHYETSLSNFFAAGNCCFNPNKIDMIITGVAEATIAINYIYTNQKKDVNKTPFYTN